MIRPVIKSFDSTDWDLNPIESTGPLEICVHVEIGDVQSPGADTYQVVVVNTEWVRTRHGTPLTNDDILPPLPRAYLVLNVISLPELKTYIDHKIEEFGPYSSWPEFAMKLSHYLIWEFEGQDYPPLSNDKKRILQ